MSNSPKYLIAGNWKMNCNAGEGAALASEIVAEVGQQTDVNVCFCPAFTALETVSKELNGSNISLGAQNMHFEASGAYTGEVSAEMLRHLFVNYVILGHSERREEYFGETDAVVNQKTRAALAASLKPIVCVRESLEQREADETIAVIKTQVEAALAGVTAEESEALVIAYEPIWAIGTGKTTTPEMAEAVHLEIPQLPNRATRRRSCRQDPHPLWRFYEARKCRCTPRSGKHRRRPHWWCLPQRRNPLPVWYRAQLNSLNSELTLLTEPK